MKKDETREWIGVLTRAVQVLDGSAPLKNFLGVVLTVGNYMNGGTNRGQADGFGVDALGKLSTVKASSDSNGTLLQFICNMFNKKYPGELQKLKADVAATAPAARVHLADSESAFRLFSNEVKSAIQMVEKVKANPVKEYKGHSPDPLAETVPAQMKALSEELDAIAVEVQGATESYEKLLVKFAVSGNARTKPTTDFFEMWKSFAMDLSKCD